MATIKPSYASVASITITLASLANTNSRASAVVDNTSTLYDDALLNLLYKTGSGTVGNGRLLIWGYAYVDASNYTDGATGSDAAFTTANIVNAVLIGVAGAGAASTAYIWGPRSVANAFGGRLPQKWGVIVQNDQGQTLDATAGNFTLEYTGVQYTVA